MRVELQNMNLKKTGKNKFANYTYYELSDFLPQVNKLCSNYNIFTTVTFDSNFAYLTIIDCDNKDSRIEYKIQLADATTKGQLPIQSVGSLITYMRRYLYMLAFEISENDYIDSETRVIENMKIDKKDKPKFITNIELSEISKTLKATGYSADNLKTYCIKNFKKSDSRTLTYDEYQDCIMEMESSNINQINDYDAKTEMFEIQSEGTYGKD